jgi:hypothetical protein
MFFSSKTKGYFVEQSDYTMLLARTSAPKAPMVVEELRMCPVNDAEAIAEAIHIIQPKPGPSGYLNACCGVYPAKRLVRRASLELKRAKEPGYFPELLTTQFRIEPDKFTIHLINAIDGSDFDVSKATQKDVLFCGLPSDDIVAVQDARRAGRLLRLHQVQDADAGPRDQHRHHPLVHRLRQRGGGFAPDPAGSRCDGAHCAEGIGPEGRGIGQEALLFEHL